MADSHDGMERVSKKLRSSEPDLKIVLGSGGDEFIQWCHSISLASKSKYVDAMLSTPMREQEDHVISFPDIIPGIWESMMTFLDSPIAARQMKAVDALDVAIFYDKYEFSEGSSLCDQIVLEYFNSLEEMEKNHTLDLDMVIDLAIVSHQANLDAAFKEGIKYLWRKMVTRKMPYGRTMFSEEHMKKLVPILKFSRDSQMNISYMDTYFLAELFSENEIKPGTCLEQPDFPIRFVSESHKQEDQNMFARCISHIELYGTTCNADGKFWPIGCAYRREGVMWEEQTVHVEIMHCVEEDDDFEGWAIVRRYPATRVDEDGDPDEDSIVEKKCWIAPYSKDRGIPPLRGWKSSDLSATGNPKLRYVLSATVG